MPITPNMDLDLPAVSVTVGPDWATLLNAALTLVDSHDHSDGKGVRVTQSGLNITGNLTLNDAYLTDVGSVRLVSQAATLATAQDVRSVYSVLGDLYYNNASGTAIQITSGGSVTAASDGISRAFSRTSVNSNTVISAAGTTSYYDVDTTSGVTFTLPAANGVAAGRFYEFKDTTGSAGTNNIVINRAGSDTIDGATSFTISYNYGGVRLISDGASKWTSNEIKTNQIATAMIQSSAVTTAKIADGNVTQAKRVALGQQISSSSGTFSTTSSSFVDVTNLSVTITTTGRPVVVALISDDSTADSYIEVLRTGTVTQYTGKLKILRDATTINQTAFLGTYASSATLASSWPVSSINHVDVPSAGTYTYKVQAIASTTNTTVGVFRSKLIAYEL